MREHPPNENLLRDDDRVITLQERVHAAPKPLGWQLDKLHRVFRVRRGHKNDGMKEDNLLSLSYGRIVQKDIDTAEGLLPESFDGYQIVEPGNIILRLTDLQNDKRSLRQGLVTQRGIITSAYDAVEVQRDNDPRFWFYALLALDLAKHYYSLGGGVRQSLKFADFPNDWVYRPDLETQRQIAEFLDRETARIDLLIEKKQKFTDLLAEKRFSETSSLLSGELFVNEQQQKTSIPFVRSIPSTWTETRMKNVCSRIIDCKNRTPDEVENGEYFVVRTTCVRNGLFVQSGGYCTDEKSYKEWTQRGKPQKYDVIFTREAPVGEACIAPANLNFCLGQRTMIFRPDPKKVLPEYIVATVYSSIGKSYIGEKGKGSTVGHLRVPEVYNFPCLLPPIEAQRTILNELHKRTGHFDDLEQVTNVSIDRLKEYRSALITAAVTGQIDVKAVPRSGAIDRRLDALQEEIDA